MNVIIEEKLPKETVMSIFEYVNSNIDIYCPFQPDVWLLNGFTLDTYSNPLLITSAKLSGMFKCQKKSVLDKLVWEHTVIVTIGGKL